MRKLTQEEFVQRMSEINPNITIIGEYINARTKILCKCNIDGNIWSATPDSLSRGRGCPKCGKNYRKNTAEFKEELSKINPNIEILSEYINDRTKVKCRCLIDGYEWSTTPRTLLRGSGKGCPKCTHHIHKTTEMFIEELSQISSDINILSEYEHYEKNVKCECKICGHIWFATPHNLLHGTGCPICCISKGEKKINTFLKKYNIEFEPKKMYDDLLGVGGKNLSYDFYLPQFNMLIEYQGNFHDGNISESYKKKFNFARQQEHDRRKSEYAKQHDIRLLEIWYQDYDNVESILSSELNIKEYNDGKRMSSYPQ